METEALFGQAMDNIDLADGKLTPEQRGLVNLTTEAWHFKRSQQGSVFSIVIAIAVLLYMIAGIFGGIVLYQAASQPQNWHVWLVSVSFLLPPTILCVALVRAVYPKPTHQQQNKDSDDSFSSVPAANFIRELLRTVRE